MDAEEWKTQPAWIRIRIRFRIRAGGKQLHGVSSSSAQMVVVMVGQWFCGFGARWSTCILVFFQWTITGAVRPYAGNAASATTFLVPGNDLKRKPAPWCCSQVFYDSLSVVVKNVGLVSTASVCLSLSLSISLSLWLNPPALNWTKGLGERSGSSSSSTASGGKHEMSLSPSDESRLKNVGI